MLLRKINNVACTFTLYAEGRFEAGEARLMMRTRWTFECMLKNNDGMKSRGTLTRFNVQRTYQIKRWNQDEFIWLWRRSLRAQAQPKLNTFQKIYWSWWKMKFRWKLTTMNHQVNSGFVLLLRWMETIIAERRNNLCYYFAMKMKTWRKCPVWKKTPRRKSQQSISKFSMDTTYQAMESLKTYKNPLLNSAY